jgi:Lar family restriction alleviation protein
MKEEIKPCPFCGSSDLSIQTSTKDREGVPSNVVCQDCGCAGPWAYLKSQEIDAAWLDNTIPKELIKLWNERK